MLFSDRIIKFMRKKSFCKYGKAKLVKYNALCNALYKSACVHVADFKKCDWIIKLYFVIPVRNAKD